MSIHTRRLEMSILVTPNMSNFGGKMHGGELLKKLDEIAYSCGMKYSGHYVVTQAVSHVTFRDSISIGELLHFNASVNYVGNTSMEIGIQVIAENLNAQSVRHTTSCYFTMVAVDESRKPICIDRFDPETDIEKRRWQEAQQRLSHSRAEY